VLQQTGIFEQKDTPLLSKRTHLFPTESFAVTLKVGKKNNISFKDAVKRQNFRTITIHNAT
jgi:hypothetical protein